MKKSVVLFLAFVLVILACSDDFTENPRPDVVDLESFFLEEQNVEEAVVGIYDLMQYAYGRDWHSAFLVKLLPGDDANAAGGNSQDQPQLQDIDDYTNISVSNASIQSVWDLFYRTVALSNLVINSIETSTLPNRDRAMAEAKFFRAWCYFELTTMFGDIPLRVTVPSTPEEFAIGKSPRADIYTQIEADLTDAIAGLPDKSMVANQFRVSQGAAQALMGKVLVFQGRNSEAIPFFESVINNGSHDLETNVADVWSVGSEF